MKIFLLLIFTIFAFSVDINKTIVDGNITIYNNLLKELKDKNQTKDISLQKTLLEELIKNNSFKIETKKIEKPKNIDEYKNLFITYLDTISKIDSLKNKLIESQKKLNTIKDEISSLEANSTNLLSYNLQYAFYKKRVNFYKSQIDEYNKQIELIQKYINSSLKEFFYDNELIKNSIKSIKLKLNNIQSDIEKLKISKEQAELINNQKSLESINKKLNDKIAEYKKLTKELLANNFLYFSSLLKSKDNKAFEEEKNIEKEALDILTKDEVNNYLLSFLLSLEKTYLGQIQTIAGSSKEEIKDVIYKSWQFVNKPIFNINDTPISIFKMVLALVIFILGFLVGALYKYKINKIASNRLSLTPSTRTIISNLGYYIIITIAFFVALNILGVKLSSIALVAGALSVGIGFGLQNVVSNFVSGLILMFERSIKIGDYIEVDDNIRGYVTDIRMRSTTITTNENIDIIIPNQSFIQNNVINWTMNDNIRRFSIPFGVAYGSDVHKVIDVVKNAVINSEYRDDIIENEERQTRVIMTEMADSSVNFELLVWVKGDKLHRPKRTKSEFLIIIYDALYANNIEIPFPQQDIHIRSISKEIPITIKKSCND